MKTNFFLTSLIIVLFSITANSQITKGNWMVGGDGYYSSSKSGRVDGSGEYTPWHFTINPNIGYFLKNKLVAGTVLDMKFSNFSGRYLLSPFVRYYFLKPDKVYNVFSSINAGYGFISSKNNQGNTVVSDFGLKVGGVVFLNSIVGLEFSINYSKTYQENIKNDFRTGKRDNINIGFGLQIHLEKNK